jgi:hypothetical protein
MVWLSLSLQGWRRAKIYSVGRRGGGSVVMVENPFAQSLERGATGFLCTGTSVWAFVVLDAGGVLTLELRGGEAYDAKRHGALERVPQPARTTVVG